VLVIFVISGMAVKLYLSANQELSSDTVGMGLESMEIWKHQNYLLTGYHVTAADTFFFTELVPFQLVPQILT
jgi:glutathionyl-hydroquinone reductase